MKIKKITALLTATLLSLGMFSTTAFAYVDESAVAETEPVVEETVEVEEEPMGPLTPDGNLTLVDDYGSTDSGKQFITVVTKAGNYFYLIIDRDDEGEQTVHFMNLVDEADLLALMDDEEAQKYTDIVEEPETTVEATPTPEPTETEPAETEQENNNGNMLPAIIGLLVLLCGGGVFAFMKLKEKKKAEQDKPDPDADYSDDEDDGEEYDFPDDEDEIEDTSEDDEPFDNEDEETV